MCKDETCLGADKSGAQLQSAHLCSPYPPGGIDEQGITLLVVTAFEVGRSLLNFCDGNTSVDRRRCERICQRVEYHPTVVARSQRRSLSFSATYPRINLKR